MSVRNPHKAIDQILEEQDRLIARRLRGNNQILRIARRNLRRWIARDKCPRRVFLEWNLVLNRLSGAEIADFLESQTPMAQRLRQSSPFAGVLSDADRLAILRKYETTRT